MLPSIETLQILAGQAGQDKVSSPPAQSASAANVPSCAEPQAKRRSRVLIVENHPAVRQALAIRIGGQDDLEVCGETADRAALRLVADTQPDVAVDAHSGAAGEKTFLSGERTPRLLARPSFPSATRVGDCRKQTWAVLANRESTRADGQLGRWPALHPA